MEIEAVQRERLSALFATALEAADVRGKLDPFLPADTTGRAVVVGGGKAAAAMASELDRIWMGPLSGAVVTPYGYHMPSYSGRIEVLQAGHPVPDANSVAAARKMIELVAGLGPSDVVIALISGGASALLVGLPDGLTLEDKQVVTKALLKSGATISEINTVRKHISTIKGGRLARAAYPARVITLAVSDVPGDNIAEIGSGPTIACQQDVPAARAILQEYGITVSASIERHMQELQDETIAADDRGEQVNAAHIVVRSADVLAQAARLADQMGYEPVLLGDDLEGEARELGAAHARLALQLAAKGRRVCVLSGGETTVTVTGDGRGGRNTEYLLGLVQALAGRPGIAALAVDSDGIDGMEDNAGAMAFASTLSRADALGIDAQASLDNNDAYTFFSAVGDLVTTGPTCTNINDFRAILIEPDRASH